MAIRALTRITNRDKKGNIIEHKPGDIVCNLSEEDEQRLIELGSAEEVDETPKIIKKSSSNDDKKNEQ